MNLNLMPRAIESAYRDLLATEGSYEDFVEEVYKDIDEITTDMLTAVEYYRELDEVQISHNIWMNLKRKWPTVQKDSDTNGNADISINFGSFFWIAEAKIWGGPNKYGNTYLYGGYTQLTERYSKGQIGATAGAMLIYIKPNNAEQTESQVMQKWQEHLASQLGQRLLSLTPCTKKSSCIYTVQPHSGTKYKYNVRHIPITFLHIPRDKSAQDAKKYREITDSFDTNTDGPDYE